MSCLNRIMQQRVATLSPDQKAEIFDWLWSTSSLWMTGPLTAYFHSRGPSDDKKVVVKKSVKQKKVNANKYDPVPEDGEFDKDVYAKLNKWRREVSRDLDLKLYMVLSNEVMRSLAAYRPQTEEELLKIHGIGKDKVGRYGETLLDLVKNEDGGQEEGHTRFLPK